MSRVLINPETLAEHLEAAARRYEEHSRAGTEFSQLAAHLDAQALECREWAATLREVRAIGFHGDDIEVLS